MSVFAAFFPLFQLLLVAIILVWDVLIAGRIAQVKTLPRPFVILTALAGFLLLPSLVIHLATTNAITGRTVTAVDWLWPVTVVLFAFQALYAAARRLVNPFLGFFMAAYNILIAFDAVLRFVASRGTPMPGAALLFLAATSGAFAVLNQSPTIIASPFFFFVPMVAPAFPALRPSAATFRGFLAIIAAAWVVVVVTQITTADRAVNSYGIHDTKTERLQERPAGDLDIALKLFPDLSGGPPPLAMKNDLALADTLDVSVVAITVVPEVIDNTGLDSIVHVLDDLRSDSTQLIVSLGYPSNFLPLPDRNFSETRRLKAIGEIVRRLKPDILLPAKDPYDAGTRAIGLRSPEFWEDYLTRASAEAKRVRPRVRIGVSASAYDSRDSSLYAWASAAGSPVDFVGFTLYPSSNGVKTLDAERGAADRWMQESQSTKDHWIFSVGGFPEAHGEASQERALWAAIAWATTRPVIKGVVVAESGDYGTIRGLRAADGHLRRAVWAVRRAMKGLRESAAGETPHTTTVTVTSGPTAATGDSTTAGKTGKGSTPPPRTRPTSRASRRARR